MICFLKYCRSFETLPFKMANFPADSHYLKAMKSILDSYPQHSPPLHPTQLTDQLFIGNQDNADDIDLLKNLGISHVLNCVGSRSFDLTRSPYPPEANVKGFLIIPAQDFDEFNIMRFFDDAIGFIDSAVLQGGKVLVHCSIGVNRSGAIVAAYMMISQKKRLLDVIIELKTKRLLVLCNMGFRKQLVQFARANDLLDEVDFDEPVEEKEPDKEEDDEDKVLKIEEKDEKENGSKDFSKNDIPTETGTFKPLYDEEDDDADEIRIKEKVIDLKALARKGYPSKHNIETLEEAKGVLVWSKLKDEEKLELLSDKVVPKSCESNDERFMNQSTLKNFMNVDPGIVLKVMNESYDKYKKKIANHKSPLEYKYGKHKNFEHKPFFRHNLTSKISERELNKEVDDFLSTTSSPIVKKYSEVRKFLDPLKNKQDEKVAWNKDATVVKATSSTTVSKFVKDITPAADFPTSSKCAHLANTSSVSPAKSIKELSPYATLHQSSPVSLSDHSQIVKSISNKSVKPLSYYKLQVLNEQISSKPLSPLFSSSSLSTSYRPVYRPKNYTPKFYIAGDKKK